jgi:hypothetical protein
MFVTPSSSSESDANLSFRGTEDPPSLRTRMVKKSLSRLCCSDYDAAAITRQAGVLPE